MRIIEAYQSVDGSIFKNEKEAVSNDLDRIGEEFDALLQIAISNSNGYITRSSQHRMCLTLLENKSKAKLVIAKLYQYLNEGETE